ncbi:MAG: hypothetical protein HY543_01635 [Deltaproteobacteria bacterium]|nr:hypothetical protein [Deltaproteobacteria bacterium]
MIRKLTLALGAIAVLGAAALSPTTASAAPGWHGHGHHRWHRGFGFYGPTFIAGDYCYTVKRVVETPYGPRVRRIQVCD